MNIKGIPPVETPYGRGVGPASSRPIVIFTRPPFTTPNLKPTRMTLPGARPEVSVAPVVHGNDPVPAFAPVPTVGKGPASGQMLIVEIPLAVLCRTKLLSLPPPNGERAPSAGVEPGRGLPTPVLVSSSTVPQTLRLVRLLSTTNSPGEFKAFRIAPKALTPSEPSFEPLVPPVGLGVTPVSVPFFGPPCFQP